MERQRKPRNIQNFFYLTLIDQECDFFQKILATPWLCVPCHQCFCDNAFRNEGANKSWQQKTLNHSKLASVFKPPRRKKGPLSKVPWDSCIIIWIRSPAATNYHSGFGLTHFVGQKFGFSILITSWLYIYFDKKWQRIKIVCPNPAEDKRESSL